MNTARLKPLQFVYNDVVIDHEKYMAILELSHRWIIVTENPGLVVTTRPGFSVIRINADDEIFWNEKAVSDEDLLKEGKAFLKKNGKKSTFALIYDKNATSAAFNHASSLVQKIYAQVKEDEAKSRFGKSYASLPESQKKEITDLYPLKLVELD